MKLLNVITVFGVLLVHNYTFSQKNEQNVMCWLNTEYIKCLSNHLPCECEKVVETYFSMSIDTSINPELHRIALLKFEQMESYYYRLKKDSINKFDILKSEIIGEKLGTLLFHQDTLYLYENHLISKFVQTGSSNRLVNNIYLKDNVNLINKAFINRGYPTLKIISQDTLLCACNKLLGGINLLSIKGRPDSWILEQIKDSLFIYKVINNEESDPDDPIIKEKVYEYKW